MVLWRYNRWPTQEEIDLLQEEEDQRARDHDEEADPICDCGNPGWSCRCEALAEICGWPGGDSDDPLEVIDEPSWLDEV